MSRPIKFRAWHTTARKMAQIDMLDFALDAYRARTLDGISSGSGHLADIELMQFTGITDRNGRDIYEGDILEIEGATAKVVFWQRPPAFGLDFYHNEDKWCEDWNLSDDSDRMTIIGNVYEHPNLIGEDAEK